MSLYHGTRAPFTVGGYLFPPDDTKATPRPGNSDTGWVYVTDDVDLAEWYAHQHPGRGKPRVLTVMPMSPVTHDPSPFDGEDDQYRCEWAKVVAVRILDKEMVSP